MLNKVTTRLSHFVKALVKFRFLLIVGGVLVLLVILIPLKFGVALDNIVFAIFSGGVASILATMVWKFFEELQLSLDAHAELLQTAKDFCEDALQDFSNAQPFSADYVAELYRKVVYIRKLYPSLLDKTHYNRLATKMYEIVKDAGSGVTKEAFDCKIKELQQYIKQIE